MARTLCRKVNDVNGIGGCRGGVLRRGYTTKPGNGRNSNLCYEGNNEQ